MRLREEGYPVMSLCAVLELPRSTYYHQPAKRDDQALRAAIEELAGRFPTYGSRRIRAQLRRPPYRMDVSRKQVQRLMGELGLKRSPKRRKPRTTESDHPHPRYPNLVKGMEVTYPDQVWVSDITYIRLGKEFVYLAVLMDVFTRSIRGWNLSRSLDGQLTLVALRRALALHVPTIHHSDQGVQYAAEDYIALLEGHDILISMAGQGNPQENGYAERLIRTIKEEEVELCEYEDFADALEGIGHFIEEVYQRKRIHSALGYLTPEEFEARWWEGRARAEVATLLNSAEKVSNFMGPLQSPPHHSIQDHRQQPLYTIFGPTPRSGP